MLWSVLTEYGVPWVLNRALYSCKIQMLRALPCTERLFETKIDTQVKRLAIFDIDVQAIAEFLSELSNERKSELLKSANEACEGKIQGFSSVQLDYGNPIDWQLNPLIGKRCDVKNKWFRIPDFDVETGDIKTIWEASRLTHFYLLARAYLVTSERKYYEAFSRQLNDWLEQNPYSYGANYKCGQECALRLINGLMAYTVFQKAGAATVIDENNIKELISRCYRKILGNFFLCVSLY